MRRALKEQTGMVVLDVRRPREREEPGRIPGTKNVPCKIFDLYVRITLDSACNNQAGRLKG